MHIRSIRIENFRAIRLLELEDLPPAIVVAGPNGCGKSSIFDAIRLLKSAYGQYRPNEYQLFFQEFQINIKKLHQEGQRVFYDPKKPLQIEARFQLSEGERSFLKNNLRKLLLNIAWAQELSMFSPEMGLESLVIDPTTRRTKEPEVKSKAEQMIRAVEDVFEEETHLAAIEMTPGNEPEPRESPVVELIFALYQPQHLGVVEYHGPNRSYTREQLGGINLQITDPAQKHSQHALYNTENKYRNVKTEMAAAYIRQILAEKAGIPIPEGSDINETLNELFEVFFPGKIFLGPIPTEEGGLSFPVRLEHGREHDIDELSSGEKEVLLGYLRLRSNAPRNSILLLDEPELHLNPRLIKGLPRFYQKHLGERLDNQLWLITHSDTLLRKAVEEPAYAVYHMQPAHAVDHDSNQVTPVSASAQVERALIDLVGDLATYSPRSKVVILEGGGDSKFDVHLVEQLFPLFAERVNLISGGSKNGVRTLQVLLDKAAEGGRLDARFYSIVDRDHDGLDIVSDSHQYSWNVYHIENYLLHPDYILQVHRSLDVKEVQLSPVEIESRLKLCARKTVDELLRMKMHQWVHNHVINCIDLGFNHKTTSLVSGYRKAAERSSNKISRVLNGNLTEESLSSYHDQNHSELLAALQNDEWKTVFRGRDILKRYTSQYVDGIGYERFRNLIINRMSEAAYEPPGMKKVIQSIIEHSP